MWASCYSYRFPKGSARPTSYLLQWLFTMFLPQSYIIFGRKLPPPFLTRINLKSGFSGMKMESQSEKKEEDKDGHYLRREPSYSTFERTLIQGQDSGIGSRRSGRGAGAAAPPA